MRGCTAIIAVMTYILTGLAVSSVARGDVVFSLASMRRQLGFDCWAYGAAQMLEAHFESMTGSSVALDIESDAYYWLVADRLLNAFLRKQASDGVLDVAGFTADYIHILALHGANVFAVNPRPPVVSFQFPTNLDFMINTPAGHIEVAPNLNPILNLQKELISSPMTLQAAQQKIQSAMAQVFHLRQMEGQPETSRVAWIDGDVPRAEVFDRLLGFKMPADQASQAFAFISSSLLKRRPQFEGQWFRYDDGRYWAFGEPNLSGQLRLVRLSLEHGWPVTLEGQGHVLTGLGFHATKNALGDRHYDYAVVDSDGTVFHQGLSWVPEKTLLRTLEDITVYYPAVRDALPQMPKAR